eukprot:26342_1
MRMFEPKRRITFSSTRISGGAKRLRVSFSEFSQLVVTEAQSREDSKATWYTRKEIKQFKRNASLTADSLRETRTAKTIKYIAQSAATGTPHAYIRVHGIEFIRGIEHLISPEVVKYMVDKRRRTLASVLAEQEAQKKSVSPCHRKLAQVSEMNSSFSKELFSRIQLLHA